MNKKIACVYHSIDLDGWMSAAIVKHWFTETVKRYGEKDEPVDSLELIGYNYGQPAPDLSGYDKVIMCDVSFPEKDMLELFKMNDDNSANFIWIDHHESALKQFHRPGVDYRIEGMMDVKFAACELAWFYFFTRDKMPELVRLLGRYDCFGHKGTDESQMVLEFQYGARECIGNVEDAYNYLHNCLMQQKPGTIENSIWLNGKAIYAYLCSEARSVYRNGFVINFAELFRSHPEEELKPLNFICINKERFNPVNFGIEYHAEGYDGAACFHYDGVAKLWRFSLYNDNGEVDCSLIAKQLGGGGHKGASGFVTSNLHNIFQ